VDKETRNAIERVTQRARRLLEEDFAAQLEGEFDVQRTGVVAAKPGSHLDPRRAAQQKRIVASIEHKRAAGMTAAEAVADYLRDAAFTTLNRFVALKMLEARELVQECITKREDSAGYREFCGLAAGLPLLPDSAGYRLYIESLFDELSTEIKVLFDRRDPASVLWPRRATFEALLALLNGAELAGIWGEDETIGWVYQYFNGADERRKMREESQAPRNSRELAVRNQFFTPRYVVQFLTDNTLGRIWYEMRSGNTVLAEKCEYMVRKPGEAYAPRAKKDPRDLRVLDPACGSGHFLLYAFDLLLAIYKEAHADSYGPKSEATGKTLSEDYPSRDALKKAVPGLILAHNLHGVDIDPRCAQIAQLALWMRAQKASHDFGIARAARLQIRRSNIVVAEPLVADDQIAREFVAELGDAVLGAVFKALVESLNRAGEMGLLLRVEQLVARQAQRGETGRLFAPPEERIRAALARFVSEHGGRTNTRRRLFADDAAHGVALLGIAEKRFDTVLMNPPFGTPSEAMLAFDGSPYTGLKHDVSTAFVERALEMVDGGGKVGVLITRTPFFLTYLTRWRERFIERTGSILFADLGQGVLDALVETCAVCAPAGTGPSTFFDMRRESDNAAKLLDAIASNTSVAAQLSSFRLVDRSPFIYWISDRVRACFSKGQALRLGARNGYIGALTQDDFRFTRLWWEHPEPSRDYVPFSKGGTYQPFYAEYPLRLRWKSDAAELKCYLSDYRAAKGFSPHWTAQLNGYDRYFRPGVSWSSRPHRIGSFWALPEGAVFGNTGPAIQDVNERALEVDLAVLNSSAFLGLLDLLMPRGTEGDGQTLKYELGYVATVPFPTLAPDEQEHLSSAVRAVGQLLAARAGLDERSPRFCSAALLSELASETGVRSLAPSRSEAEAQFRDHFDAIDQIVCEAYARTADLTADDVSTLVHDVRARQAESRHFAFKSRAIAVDAVAALSALVGVAFGRFSVAPVPPTPESLFAPIPRFVSSRRVELLVDDPGAAVRDVEHAVLAAARDCWGLSADRVMNALLATVGEHDLRVWLRRDFFGEHLSAYTSAKRAAPIYWQLATPSASYSVWLYIHAFSQDTLFRVQNDYATPKLAQEERRLDSLTSELRDKATAGQRSELVAQASLVEELRAFLEEVKRVAPLWNPNLDDGVIITFAPLWRLVPQQKAWQKELKATWDAICEGKYDWSHLAMHLWPERVVPKCATDRSLAIAHGLEEVFWVEGSDGKWTARKTPTRPIEELVRERSSAAVKAALKSLVEAPPLTGSNGARKGGRRRSTAALGEEA